MTRLEAIRLLKAELPEEAEARYIIPDVLKIGYSEAWAFGEKALTEEEEKRLFEIIERRKKHEPLQYILKEWYFMDLALYVDERVLIPRQDTETLAELAIDYAGKNRVKTALDICTGSGCIALSLKKALPELTVTASDIMPGAIEVAKMNAERNGLAVSFAVSDLFNSIEGVFGMITANPPYIAEDVYETLAPELGYEPKTALVAEDNGLALYKRIANEAKAHLDGKLFLEIGYDEAESVCGFLRENGYSDIKVYKDIAGNDRVVSGEWHG